MFSISKKCQHERVYNMIMYEPTTHIYLRQNTDILEIFSGLLSSHCSVSLILWFNRIFWASSLKMFMKHILNCTFLHTQFQVALSDGLQRASQTSIVNAISVAMWMYFLMFSFPFSLNQWMMVLSEGSSS